MHEAKQRSEQHLIDAEGERVLRSLLPRHWVLREYRPDYGLDFALETFRPPEQSKKFATYETLGEHLFIQLKSVASAAALPLQLYGRGNVEKQPERLHKDDPAGVLDTIRFSLETSELVTVERMGVGVPVLLVIADISISKCFFVCLNDYIDKILIPRHGDYTGKASRTIHVPVLNEVSDPAVGKTALSWYAKRPKLYAAFQRFVFQEAELRYAWGTSEALSMTRYFASRIASYDFWTDTEMWGLIGYYGAALKRFISDGHPGLMRIDSQAVLAMTNGNAEAAQQIANELQKQEVLELWRLLSVLPRNYEDVCREWFLPTALGYASSYPSSAPVA
ncbi:MAG: DUF4365 domain-containing protein [Patescibacteria group bacterium]|nr:DUF4365 domain-containing protein [Patescibacteria group bacterium]